MIKFIVVMTMTLASTYAYAGEHNTLGVQVDVGVPDGAGVGLVVRPVVDWLRLNMSFNYNGVAPGLRAGATLDPINFGIAPTLTLEGGTFFQGKVPGLNNSPSFGYDYLNLHLGLEGGKRNSWRLFLHAGPTWVSFRSSNFSQFITDKDQSLSVSDPHGTATLLPTFKLGFTKYF